MTRTQRKYIAEHGMTAARKKFPTLDDTPIVVNGFRAGVVKRYEHPIYQKWVWQAVIKYKGVIYTNFDFDSQITMIDWAERKINALEKPQFGIMLRETIASTPFTVEQIAEMANCSRYVIFKWMRSESWPPIHTLQRITKAISPSGWPPLFDAWCAQIELEQ